MIPRYSLPELAKIWEPENKFNVWLKIEILVCEALAKRREIPASAVVEIKKKAKFDIKRIDEIEKYKEKKIVVYCRSGNRSSKGTKILIKYGFEAMNLSGGILQWKGPVDNN